MTIQNISVIGLGSIAGMESKGCHGGYEDIRGVVWNQEGCPLKRCDLLLAFKKGYPFGFSFTDPQGHLINLSNCLDLFELIQPGTFLSREP